jgi:hypothetical protein
MIWLILAFKNLIGCTDNELVQEVKNLYIVNKWLKVWFMTLVYWENSFEIEVEKHILCVLQITHLSLRFSLYSPLSLCSLKFC